MIPKLTCGECGAAITRGDKFCSSCGAAAEWGEGGGGAAPASAASLRTGPSARGGKKTACPSCGQENAADARVCASCGTALRGRERAPKGVKPAPRLPAFLQGWKPLVALAVILVAAVFAAKTFRREPVPEQSASPQEEALLGQIAALQKAVDENPRDTDALLRLGNLLYDARQFPRAVVAYGAYLAMNPANADARVDMAIGYFNMSFTDTLHRMEHLLRAKREMETAVGYAPKHQLAYFNLGIVSFHTGEEDSAIAYFRKCIAVDPKSETARRAQEFLDQHKITTRPLP